MNTIATFVNGTTMSEPKSQNIRGWQDLFVARTRLDFLHAFVDWKGKGGTELPDEGKNMICLSNEQVLYYYEFQECHQYSAVMLQRLCDTPSEKLLKEAQRFVKLLANDNVLVGKLLMRSVSREFVKRKRKSKRELAKEQITEVTNETEQTK